MLVAAWRPASAASTEPLSQPAVDARAWGVLAVLWFVYVLNFLDRQLLSILAKPIQDTLHVTDGQLGLIGGLYFAFFYCFIAVPVGWFADRTNRVTRAVARLRDLERGDDGLRHGATLSAARRRADDGRLRRGGRRAAVLCADHRPVPARAARHGVRDLQPRPADRRGARHRVRRVDRGGVRLALRVHRDRRDRRSSRPRRCACSSASRCAAASTSNAAPRARRSGRSGETLRMFFSRKTLVLAALGSGATQIDHVRPRQLHDAVPDAREGHDAEGGRDLVRARRAHRHERGDGRLGPPDRPDDAAIEGRLRHAPGDVARVRAAVLRRVRLGADLAALVDLPHRCTDAQLLLPLLVGGAGAGGGAAEPARDVGRAAAAGDELHRAGPRADLGRRGERLVRGARRCPTRSRRRSTRSRPSTSSRSCSSSGSRGHFAARRRAA